MVRSSLDHLPDEVLLEILWHLRSTPLSQSYVRRQPAVDIFTNPTGPLKALSRTCKRWRRLTLACLAKHLALDLNHLLRKGINSAANEPNISEYEALVRQTEHWCTCANALGAPGSKATLLVQCKESPTQITQLKTLQTIIPSIWQTIFRIIEPCRIVLQARHSDLLLLIGGGISASRYGQGSSYLDDFQLLELDRKLSQPREVGSHDEFSDYGLATKARGLRSSMLHMRPWSHIGLNEGCVTQLPEFGVRGQLVRDYHESLIAKLFPPCCFQQATQHSHRWQHLRDEMSWLDAFSLTTLYSPTNYLPSLRNIGGVHQWQFVRQITLSLLPDPDDVDIFHLPSDEQAVWWQLRAEQALSQYFDLRRDMVTRYMQKDWRLRKIICLDDTIIQGFPVFVRKFELGMADIVANMDGDRTAGENGDPRVKWGRVWEVTPGDDVFIVHD